MKIFLKLFPLLVLAIFFRFWLISNNQIYFWYDQARDAQVSQEIIINKDLKIQGPSASGTNDTIYHGVLYYYLIAPLYVLFDGNPFLVTLVFSAINSLSVVLIYFLTKEVFKNERLALIAAALLAINFEHAQYSTWLSNPMIALLPVLTFFYSLWRLFYQENKKGNLIWPLLMGVSLGIIEQSAFYSVYFFGAILVGVIFSSKQNKQSVRRLFSLKQVLVFLVSYGLLISTMLFNQFKLFRAGIFTLNGLKEAFGSSKLLVEPQLIGQFFVTYFTKIIESLTPTMTIFGTILLFVLAWSFFNKTSKAIRYFLLSWLLAPLWLFVIHFRNSPHMLFGIEYVLLIILAFFLESVFKQKSYLSKIIGLLITSVYIICQFGALQLVRNQSTSIFTFQKGVMLKNELNLIDRTYQLANGQPFSISIWGSPYEYYVTWAYLYDWYGRTKYGYLPSYFGTSQIGKFGSDLLEQKDSTAAIHFLIEEPQINLVGNIYQQFIAKQDSLTLPQITTQTQKNGFELFGEYRLQLRK
ncbi:glycosyltransferase family 39 protein [Patescibacteria group bacterium]|nr:glycosyltransferase family 39 protein [Patescibacteria group bacterium]